MSDFALIRSLQFFPKSAFQESMEIAWLRREPPALVNAYGELFHLQTMAGKKGANPHLYGP